MRYLVSFKKNDKEKELEKWILKECEIIGFSSFMKQLAYEKMTKKDSEQVFNNDNNDFDFDFKE